LKASPSVRTSARAGRRRITARRAGRDLDTDPRWQPYKTRPLEVGLKACWSTPIKAKDGRVIGTFAFYFREPRAPSRWHQRIVDACVHLGALAIERKEARAQIARPRLP
jgi:GAF domain-containing protein